MDTDFRLVLRSIADLAMPRICIVCGRKLLLREEHICTVCGTDLPLTLYAGMRDNPMSESFNGLIQRDLMEYEPFSYACSLFYYSGPYRKITQALKYKRNFGAGRCFARMLGREMAASPLFADVDMVVPVPLHWARRLSRGYNQAEVIASGVAEELGAPGRKGMVVAPWLVERRRKTRSQALLQGREQRFANVRSAFCVPAKGLKRLRRLFPDPGHLHILLVDDVYTTGATLTACHRALRSALGPSVRISAATLACVNK